MPKIFAITALFSEHLLLEELELLDNITSCNVVDNYLMLDEYEQNLIKEGENPGGGGGGGGGVGWRDDIAVGCRDGGTTHLAGRYGTSEYLKFYESL